MWGVLVMKKRKILVIVIAALVILAILTGCPQKNNEQPIITKESGPSGTIDESSSTFKWSGNDPDGSIEKYYYRKDGGSWYSTTGTSYTWSGYSEDSHTFEVRAQDNEGAYSNIISWSFTYDEDNQPPTVTKVSGPSGTIKESSSTFKWSGNDPDGSIDKYYYRKDGGSWNTTVGTSYTWSGYSEDSHTFEVRAQDNDGAYSSTINWSFTYDEDNQPPTVTKVSGPSGTIKESSSTFEWSGSDLDGTIDHYEYRKDGGSWNTTVGTSYTWSGYSEDSHTFEVKAEDNDGAYSSTISWSFTYDEDNQPPTVTKVSGPSGTIKESSSTFTWDGNDSDGTIDHYEYREDGGSWVNYGTSESYSWTGYTEGSHTFEVRAEDNDGAYSEVVTWAFTFSVENPSLFITDDYFTTNAEANIYIKAKQINNLKAFEINLEYDTQYFSEYISCELLGKVNEWLYFVNEEEGILQIVAASTSDSIDLSEANIIKLTFLTGTKTGDTEITFKDTTELLDKNDELIDVSLEDKGEFTITDSENYELQITVKNINSTLWENAKVILYDNVWNYLDYGYTDVNGLVTFTGITAGKYRYEVYYDPEIIDIDPELWGGEQIEIVSSDLEITFTRIMPIIRGASPTGGELPSGDLTPIVKTQTTNGVKYNIRARFIFDKDKTESYDYDYVTGPKLVGSDLVEFQGETYNFTEETNFYVVLEAEVRGKYIPIDQYGWKNLKPKTDAVELTVTTSPETGLEVQINGTNYTSPKTASFEEGESVDIGVISPQEKDKSGYVTGTDTRYTFNQWNDGNTNKTRTITINSDKTYTAEMDKEYKVETGTNPESLVTISEAGWYEEGTAQSFTAPEVTGYTFDHWEVNGSNAGTNEQLNLTIDSPKEVIAVYTKDADIYSLTVTTSPDTGLEVQINGTNYTSPKTASFEEGESVDIGVTSPQEKDESGCVTGTDTRYTFNQWNDGNTNKTRTITINSDKTYTAEMDKEYKVETETNPESLVTISGAGWYEEGTAQSFTAPEVTGYTFDHWEVNGSNAGTNEQLNLTIDSPKEVIAVYEEVISGTVLSLSSESLNVSSNQEFSIHIVIENVEELKSGLFKLDIGSLEFVEAVTEGIYSDAQIFDCSVSSGVLTIETAVTMEPVSGTGNILELKFKATNNTNLEILETTVLKDASLPIPQEITYQLKSHICEIQVN
jgi:hypothetical protein